MAWILEEMINLFLIILAETLKNRASRWKLVQKWNQGEQIVPELLTSAGCAYYNQWGVWCNISFALNSDHVICKL